MKSALACASVLLLCAALATAALAEDLGDQVAKVCSACHGVARVCGKLGSGQDYWKATVSRMIANGADMPGGEAGPMAAYLAGLDKAKAPFCK